MPAMPTTGLVKIRGLPYRVTAMDIATFFHGFSFHPEMIQIAMGGDGRPNGEAYCTFVSPEEAQRAIYMKNRQHIGNRYVEIFPA
jgi:RNA recognition motif-containing protein